VKKSNNKAIRKMKIEMEAYQVVEKVAKSAGNSGRVYVPIDWVGKRVKILLIEPLDEENERLHTKVMK